MFERLDIMLRTLVGKNVTAKDEPSYAMLCLSRYQSHILAFHTQRYFKHAHRAIVKLASATTSIPPKKQTKTVVPAADSICPPIGMQMRVLL